MWMVDMIGIARHLLDACLKQLPVDKFYFQDMNTIDTVTYEQIIHVISGDMATSNIYNDYCLIGKNLELLYII